MLPEERTQHPEASTGAWTAQVEALLEDWHHRVYAAQSAHYASADRFRTLNYVVGVPAVIFSSVVGTALFALFIWYLFRRLGTGRALGKLLARVGDPAAARVRPLAWGMTAALAGTMVANVFYLTMSFYYFYVFAVLALAAPLVFGRRLPRR